MSKVKNYNLIEENIAKFCLKSNKKSCFVKKQLFAKNLVEQLEMRCLKILPLKGF